MTTSFSDLGVPAALVARLNARGIMEPFPIQEAALPDAFARRDVVGKAPTGSGKTLAFGLALVHNATKASPRRPRGLVLVPTRELAAQVQKELGQLTSDKGRRVLCIYGGTSYNVARKALAMGVDIVVACPGRLEDMLEQRALDLSEVTTVVVDEADRMADMGFLPAVRRIVSMTAENRHMLLFSATMGPDVKSLVREFTHDAAIHDVVGDEAPSDVDHFFWRVPREQRSAFTAELADRYDRAIVFTRTKHGADRLARQLEERGISAVPIHGDRTQAQRERALRSVKNGQIRVLVATVIHRPRPRITCTVQDERVAPAPRAPSFLSSVKTSLDKYVDSKKLLVSKPSSTTRKTPWLFDWVPWTTPPRRSVWTTVRRRNLRRRDLHHETNFEVSVPATNHEANDLRGLAPSTVASVLVLKSATTAASVPHFNRELTVPSALSVRSDPATSAKTGHECRERANETTAPRCSVPVLVPSVVDLKSVVTAAQRPVVTVRRVQKMPKALCNSSMTPRATALPRVKPAKTSSSTSPTLLAMASRA